MHYFDPHTPYAPAAPFAAAHAKTPYLGEIAAMDEQLGRLVQAFDAFASRQGTPSAIVVTSDHGEGLGDHGELQHGNLLYQSTMHVPLVVVGPGTAAAVDDEPVSTRRVFHTILEWAGLEPADQPATAWPAAQACLAAALAGRTCLAEALAKAEKSFSERR